jgi:anti-sigma B factor antagonist
MPWPQPMSPDLAAIIARTAFMRWRTLGPSRRTTEAAVRFEVKEDQSSGRTRVFALAGDLDLATASGLRVELFEVIAAGARQLVLDLEQLAFIDSTGIATLLSLRRRIHAAGGAVAVANVSDQVARVLKITGVASPLNLQPSVAAAISSVTADVATAADPGQRRSRGRSPG